MKLVISRSREIICYIETEKGKEENISSIMASLEDKWFCDSDFQFSYDELVSKGETNLWYKVQDEDYPFGLGTKMYADLPSVPQN
jgi:hypothetical protein